MKRAALTLLGAGLGFCAGLAVLPYAYGAGSGDMTNAYHELDRFGDAFAATRKGYVEAPEDKAMIEGAIFRHDGQSRSAFQLFRSQHLRRHDGAHRRPVWWCRPRHLRRERSGEDRLSDRRHARQPRRPQGGRRHHDDRRRPHGRQESRPGAAETARHRRHQAHRHPLRARARRIRSTSSWCAPRSRSKA